MPPTVTPALAKALIAQTPRPPYYAVIFTNLRTEGDKGYAEMADRMVELAAQQPGFLGIESAREGSAPESALPPSSSPQDSPLKSSPLKSFPLKSSPLKSTGITLSYWQDLASIKAWKANVEHLEAQRLGHERWYSAFKVRIARVERDYEM